MMASSDTFIAGVGATEQGTLPGLSADDIAVDALLLALDDAGLSRRDVDGLVTCPSNNGQGQDTTIGRMAGLEPSFSASLAYGACNFSLHVACAAIAAGLATCVVLAYGTNQRSSRRSFADPVGLSQGGRHGFQGIAGPAAMAFRRHQHLYGTTEEQLATVAVTQRAYAARNPLAVFREPLDLDSYLAAPYLVAPLRRADVCMVSDGGAAVVVCAAGRAGDRPKPPVYVRAMAQAASFRPADDGENLMRLWIADVAERVYRAAGLGPADVDLLYIQDPSSVWVLQMLEWYGFCPVGEAGPYLTDVGIGPDSPTPVNTNGGQLSEAYMWGWLHLVEAVRQLRWECGDRQVGRPTTAQHCSTMGFKKAASTVLSRVGSDRW